MKTKRTKQLLQEFEDVFGSLAIVSVNLRDETLSDQIQEYANEYRGEMITEDPESDGLYLEFQFEDPIEAEEFQQFMIGSDWFGDEIVSVSLHSEEGHIEGDSVDIIPIEEDDADIIPIDDSDEDDVQAHIDQQEEERDEFRSNYIPDVGEFDDDDDERDFGFDGIEDDPNVYTNESTDNLNVQGHGGDVVKNDYAMQVESLRKMSIIAGAMTLNEFREHRPIDKSTWKSKWKNDGPNSSVQSSSRPYHVTKRGSKKDPKTHHIKSTIAKNGSGWDMIQSSTDQYTDEQTDLKVGKQVDDFHAKNRSVRLIPKQGDLKEGNEANKPYTGKSQKYRGHIDEVPDVIDHKGWEDIQDASSEDSNVAQTRRTREQAKAFLKHRHVPFAKDTDLKESVNNDNHFSFKFEVEDDETMNGRYLVGGVFNPAEPDVGIFDQGLEIDYIKSIETNEYYDIKDFSEEDQERLESELGNAANDHFEHIEGEHDHAEELYWDSMKERSRMSESLDESLDETVDEISDVGGIGGYTVPLGAKPANMKRNADVWRRNNKSKNPKANDTVKQNQAPTQSATSVKKDRKKAKAPYTGFADQSNVPFKHKSRTTKYGVSDSPASAIGGQ